ncbi:MAG: hypothetical protein ACJ788_02585, partial [Ktedonobacteraceae bacterium]
KLINKKTLYQSIVREELEETGYMITIDGIVGVYSSLKRDPRFRAASIAYKGSIVSGSVQSSGEGKPCWREPAEVVGKLAFDCEDMLNDYLNGRQCLS